MEEYEMKKKTIAVIGAGAFGRSVAFALMKKGCEVMVMDKNEALIQSIADFVTYAVCADAKDASALHSAGIRNYHTVVVSIGENITDSALATMLLKEEGVKKVICKASDMNHKRLLEKVGADRVIIPDFEMGNRLASSIVNDHMLDSMELSADHSLAEIAVPKQWVGKNMIDLNLRRKYGITVLGFREGEDVCIEPDPSRVLRAEDILIVVGENMALDVISNMK